jgi:hypothetical protein
MHFTNYFSIYFLQMNSEYKWCLGENGGDRQQQQQQQQQMPGPSSHPNPTASKPNRKLSFQDQGKPFFIDMKAAPRRRMSVTSSFNEISTDQLRK